MFKSGAEKAIRSLLDNGAQLQAPAVAKNVARFRRAHPEESPAQIIERLEKLFDLYIKMKASGGPARKRKAETGA